MQQEIVLEVKNVSKGFLLSEALRTNLKEAVTGFFSGKKEAASFQALHDISFQLHQGEVIGIIGKNGAGKSTLLKILSGITLPDEGEINFYGKPVSILDVGAGFHPELTGKENIVMVAQLYGLSRKEINARLNDIIGISGIGKFADEPVKNYSSGMYVRLAFSLVIGLDADIMIFDEVLGVGDADFQLTVMEHIKRMIERKRSIILVTHNPRDIINLCDRVIHIEGGKVKAAGGNEVLADYLNDTVEKHVSIEQMYGDAVFESESKDSIIKRVSVGVIGEAKMYGDEELQIELQVHSPQANLSYAVMITDTRGTPLLSSYTDVASNGALQTIAGTHTMLCTVPPNIFNHGTYLLSLFVLKDGLDVLERHKNVLRFSIGKNRNFPDSPLYSSSEASLVIPFNWQYKTAP